MKLCKRCGGSGFLLRYNEGGRYFKKCTHCMGIGVKGSSMSERIPVPGLPEPQFRPLTELEDDGYSRGAPHSGHPKPPHVLTNLYEFEKLLRGHFGAKRVRIDVDW